MGYAENYSYLVNAEKSTLLSKCIQTAQNSDCVNTPKKENAFSVLFVANEASSEARAQHIYF